MKRALVIGCATGVWQEVERAKKLGTYDTVYVIKLAGVDYVDGPFWWVTLHPDFMVEYIALRRSFGHPDNYRVLGPLLEETAPRYRSVPIERRMTYKWDVTKLSGSSGLFAVKAALEDGHDKIVVAGVPMDDNLGHYRRPQKGNWTTAKNYRPAWEKVIPTLLGRVKSLSGWTSDKLGCPTQEWFDGHTGTTHSGASGADSEVTNGASLSGVRGPM